MAAGLLGPCSSLSGALHPHHHTQAFSHLRPLRMPFPLWDTSQDISLILGFMTNPLEVCSLPVSQPDYELQKGRKFVNPVTTRIPVLSPMPNIC